MPRVLCLRRPPGTELASEGGAVGVGASQAGARGVLAATIVAGLATILIGNTLVHPYDYRLTIPPYLHSIVSATRPAAGPGSSSGSPAPAGSPRC
jgi:hypothetical protein